MKKTIILIFTILASIKTLYAQNKTPLPVTVHNVMPAGAVNGGNYTPYTATSREFKGIFLPGDASVGSYAAGITAQLLEQKNAYNITIGYSSGALITIPTYIGDANFLKNFVYGLDTSTVLTENFAFFSLMFGESFADNAPLKKYVSGMISNAVIDKMKIRHKKGYRAFVITSELDGNKSAYWDIGAIASMDKTYDERRTLLTKIIIASTALPGVFQPSRFDVQYNDKTYTQIHVDGGLSAHRIIQPWMLPKNFTTLKRPRFYIVQTKEYVHDRSYTDSSIPSITLNALGNAYTTAYYGSKTDLLDFSKKYNMKTYVNIIPKTAPLNFSGFDFSQKRITDTFNAGYKHAKTKKLQWADVKR